MEEFSELVADIYDAAIDPPVWRKVLKGVCAFVQGGPSAGLFWQDAVKKTGNAYFAWGGDPKYAELYWDKYIKHNPFIPVANNYPIDHLYSAGDVLPMGEFTETVFFKEWMAPQGWSDVLSVNLDRTSTSHALLSVARHERDGIVDDEMRRRMALLVPHIRRSVMIGKLIDLKRLEAAALADTLDGLDAGAFLVDSDGGLVHANQSARSMLSEGNVMHANGKLVALDEPSEKALHDVFTAARSGESLLGAKGVAVELTAHNGDQFVTHVLPLTAGARRQAGERYAAVAAVFVQRKAAETSSLLDTLGRRYRLTPAELRILIAIVDVGGVPQVAFALNLSQATVRTHLRHIFEKTGTRRQADLVKLVTRQSATMITPQRPPGP